MDQDSEDYSEGEDAHDVSQPGAPEEDDSTSKSLPAEATTPKLAASTARLFLHGIYPQIFSHETTSATYAGIERYMHISHLILQVFSRLSSGTMRSTQSLLEMHPHEHALLLYHSAPGEAETSTYAYRKPIVRLIRHLPAGSPLT